MITWINFEHWLDSLILDRNKEKDKTVYSVKQFVPVWSVMDHGAALPAERLRADVQNLVAHRQWEHGAAFGTQNSRLQYILKQQLFNDLIFSEFAYTSFCLSPDGM